MAEYLRSRKRAGPPIGRFAALSRPSLPRCDPVPLFGHGQKVPQVEKCIAPRQQRHCKRSDRREPRQNGHSTRSRSQRRTAQIQSQTHQDWYRSCCTKRAHSLSVRAAAAGPRGRLTEQLPPNEVPCSLRLVCRELASRLHSPRYTTISMGVAGTAQQQYWYGYIMYGRALVPAGPCPPAAGAPGAGGAGGARRRPLPHVEAEAAAAWAAAAEGHGHVCDWMLSRVCPAEVTHPRGDSDSDSDSYSNDDSRAACSKRGACAVEGGILYGGEGITQRTGSTSSWPCLGYSPCYAMPWCQGTRAQGATGMQDAVRSDRMHE